MKGAFFSGLVLGAIAGAMLIENKCQTKQFMQKVKQSVEDAATAVKNDMTASGINTQN